jgi:enamine deaminase RidA (YjgF/YER057c/UK114 family)
MAARAGDLAFFAGIIGVDMERRIVLQSFEEAGMKIPIPFGSPVAQRRQEPVAVQTWAIYDQYQKILAEQGCRMGDIVRQVIYLRNMDHIPIVDEVARHFFGDSVPATTIHQVSQLAVPTYLIEIEGIAWLPRDPAASPRPVSIPSADGIEPWGRHPLAMRAGDFLFLSGLMADLPGPKKMVRGYEDLDGEGRGLATGSLLSDHREGPLVAQTWTVFDKARRVLEAEGSSLDNVVLTRVLLKDIEGLPAVERVARSFFPEDPPATMILEVPDLPLPGSLIELEVTALA